MPSKSRRLFLFINAFVLVLSLLTALRVLPGPDIVGMMLAFHALFLLPGFLLSRLSGAGQTGLLEEICRIFLGGLLFLTLVLALGFVPGFSYQGIAITGCAVTFAMLFITGGRGKMKGRGRGMKGTAGEGAEERRIRIMRVAAVLLLFIICFVFFYGSGLTRWDSDALDHMSYVRRGLDSGELFPGDSFHRGGDGAGFDPRKGIWHPMLTLWAYQGDVPPVVLWRMVPSFIAFFALAFFLLFAVTITGHWHYGAASILLLLLFYRGEGITWLVRMGFSRNMAQVALWGAVAFLIRYVETGSRYLLFWFMATVLFGTACHLVFALNLAVTCIALILFIIFFRYGRAWMRRFAAAVVLGAAAGTVPLLLRTIFTTSDFNIIHTHRQGMLLLTERFAMVDPIELLARFGPAFFFAILLLPFFVWSADGGERKRLTGTLFFVPVLLVLNPFSGGLLERALGYLHYRILYAAPLFCYLTLGLYGLIRLLVTGRGEHTAARRVAGESGEGGFGPMLKRLGSRLAAAALLLLFAVVPLRESASRSGKAVMGILEENGSAMRPPFTVELDSAVPEHSVIASDPRTSYIVSAYTDHFVTVVLDQHCSPADTAAMRKLRETRDLFSPAVPFSRSARWLLEEGVDYILVDRGYRRQTDFFATVPAGGGERAYLKFEGCPKLLEEIGFFDEFHLFRLDREALVSLAEEACRDSSGGARSCPLDEGMFLSPVATSDGITLVEIVTLQDEIAPGDTLRGHLCWSVDDGVEFGLPFQYAFRLDRDFPKGVFYRHWYGKQYRRSVEREKGRFYRFTYMGSPESGYEQPDQWPDSSPVMQEFAIPVTEWIDGGSYEMRVSMRRRSYLPNRTIGDYLLNEDSYHGVLVDSIHVARDEVHGGRSRD